MVVTLERWDYLELNDEIGISFYRWDAERSVMEWWCGDEGWCAHGWNLASLMRYTDQYEDATVTFVTADDVR